MDFTTATVVSPSSRRTALRLLLSTFAGVGGGLAVGVPLDRWATVAGRGPGFLPGLYELVVAVVVSVLVGVVVAVLTLRATSRTDAARRRLVLAYALTFAGLAVWPPQPPRPSSCPCSSSSHSSWSGGCARGGSSSRAGW